MCEFHGMVLSGNSLLGFHTLRNLESNLHVDSFIYHAESGFLSTLFQRSVAHSVDGSQTLVFDYNIGHLRGH